MAKSRAFARAIHSNLEIDNFRVEDEFSPFGTFWEKGTLLLDEGTDTLYLLIARCTPSNTINNSPEKLKVIGGGASNIKLESETFNVSTNATSYLATIAHTPLGTPSVFHNGGRTNIYSQGTNVKEITLNVSVFVGDTVIIDYNYIP